MPWKRYDCVLLYAIVMDTIILGLVARKPVFWISDKASFKPVSSATETSYKIEISPVAS